jgi:hypothetical protein
MGSRLLVTILGLSLLGGCAVQNVAQVPDDHPANPAAAETPIPPRSQTLALDNPIPTSAPAEEAAGGRHDAHRGHATGATTRPHESAAPSTERPMPATLPTSAPALFTCPMHKDVVSDKPGRCPKCNMKLVPMTQVQQQDHAAHGGQR